MASSSHFGGIVRSDSRIKTLDLGEPKKADKDGVLEAIEEEGDEEHVVTEGITDPDVPRNITVTAEGAGDIKAVKVKIEGTNAAGEEIEEEIGPFNENQEGTKEGSKAFATVTKITIPEHDGEEVDSSVGFGEAVGLGVKLPRDTVVFAFFEGTKESTAPTVKTSSTKLESNTIDLDTELNEKPVLVDLYVPGA